MNFEKDIYKVFVKWWDNNVTIDKKKIGGEERARETRLIGFQSLEEAYACSIHVLLRDPSLIKARAGAGA